MHEETHALPRAEHLRACARAARGLAAVHLLAGEDEVAMEWLATAKRLERHERLMRFLGAVRTPLVVPWTR